MGVAVAAKQVLLWLPSALICGKVSVWSMRVSDCISRFIDSCEEKNRLYIHSQGHRGVFNMEPCTPCVEK